jgi:hypothetical protein
MDSRYRARVLGVKNPSAAWSAEAYPDYVYLDHFSAPVDRTD